MKHTYARSATRSFCLLLTPRGDIPMPCCSPQLPTTSSFVTIPPRLVGKTVGNWVLQANRASMQQACYGSNMLNCITKHAPGRASSMGVRVP